VHFPGELVVLIDGKTNRGVVIKPVSDSPGSTGQS